MIMNQHMHSRKQPTSAFTLLELLGVVGIVLLMIAMIFPLLHGIQSAGNVTKAACEIAGMLDQARTHAMANNTYAWVGIAEVDVNQESSATPQASGVGRVALAAVASKDGTRGYDVNGNISSSAWVNYNNGANLVPLGKLQYFDNIHLARLFSNLPNKDGLKRPTIHSASYMIGHDDCQSVTPFYWPLGTTKRTAQYSFDKVINFDPQGTARIQYASNEDTVVQYMEIGLIPTRGNAVPSPTPSNAAAIQVDGMTGATRIFRP